MSESKERLERELDALVAYLNKGLESEDILPNLRIVMRVTLSSTIPFIRELVDISLGDKKVSIKDARMAVVELLTNTLEVFVSGAVAGTTADRRLYAIGVLNRIMLEVANRKEFGDMKDFPHVSIYDPGSKKT